MSEVERCVHCANPINDEGECSVFCGTLCAVDGCYNKRDPASVSFWCVDCRDGSRSAARDKE